MSFIRELINDSSISHEERQQALDRIYSNPGLPVPDSTASFWLEQPWKCPRIASSSVPKEADIVIIGTGITGVSVAYSVLQSTTRQHGGSTIVMLEARDVCSGATGRNGGHCLETAEEYLDLREAFGVDAALKIIKFRLSHLGVFLDIAKSLGIVEEAQVRKVQFLSAHFSVDSWNGAREAIEAFQSDAPELAREFTIVNSAQEIAALGIKNAFGIITGPAGAMWPYKFVTAVLDHLLHRYFQLLSIYENTSADFVEQTDNGYLVSTSKGVIHCKHVVHCTNGHIANLLPKVQGNIFPLRGQMSAQNPLLGRSNQAFQHSWLLNYERGYDYLTQLPTMEGVSDGEMMLGGGFASSAFSRLREIGIPNDNALDPDIQKHLEIVLDKVLVTGEEKSGLATRVRSMWTGIMGFSSDGMPWVGQLPEQERKQSGGGSQWIAAGFSGEGMVHAWLCGTALAQLIQGFDQERLDAATQEVRSWLPEQFLLTSERLHSTKMPKHLPGETEDRNGQLLEGDTLGTMARL